MPRLPGPETLDGRDPQPQTMIPSFRTDPVPGALQGFGNSISEAGTALANLAERQKAETDKAARFAQQTRFLQFEDGWNDYLTKAQQSAEPGAAGFSAKLGNDYKA